MFTANGDGESAAEFQYHLFEIITVALAAGVALIVTLSWTIYFPYSRSLALKGIRVVTLHEGICTYIFSLLRSPEARQTILKSIFVLDRREVFHF